MGSRSVVGEDGKAAACDGDWAGKDRRAPLSRASEAGLCAVDHLCVFERGVSVMKTCMVSTGVLSVAV